MRRSRLDSVLTADAFAQMIPLATRFRRGVEEVIREPGSAGT
jgi:hypothetical protein